MKNLIFSKQYLKTKLAILTLITTVGYHYLCKDKNLYNESKKHFDVDKKQDHSKNDYKDVLEFEDEDVLKEKFKEDPFDNNAAIIPSKWILEYWMSIRRRRPAVNIPSLSKGIVAELDTRKVQLNGFFDSNILKAVKEFCKINKYKDKELLYGLFWDLKDYTGIKIWHMTKLFSHYIGHAVGNMISGSDEKGGKGNLIHKATDVVKCTINMSKASVDYVSLKLEMAYDELVVVFKSACEYGNSFAGYVSNAATVVRNKVIGVANFVGNSIKSGLGFSTNGNGNNQNTDDRNNNNTAINIDSNNENNTEGINNAITEGITNDNIEGTNNITEDRDIDNVEDGNNDNTEDGNNDNDRLVNSLLRDRKYLVFSVDEPLGGFNKKFLNYFNNTVHVLRRTAGYLSSYIKTKPESENNSATSPETNAIPLNDPPNMPNPNEGGSVAPSFDDQDEDNILNETVGNSSCVLQ